MLGKKRLVEGNFLLTVIEEFRYPHASKLYRVRLILIEVDHVLSRYLHLYSSISIKVEPDYYSVINIMFNTKTIFSIGTHTY